MIEATCIDYLQQQYSNKEIVIVGMGREGISSYHTLRSALPKKKLILVDDAPLEKLDPSVSEILKSDSLTTFATNTNGEDQLPFSADVVVFKTPGIPSSHPVIDKAIAAKAQITSNTALFFELITQMSYPPLTIGITGTKGKSTTTSLIFHVLQASEKTVLLAGNIGVPALNLLENIKDQSNPETIVVLELSSHQLLDLRYSPDIAVVLNITPEHLDYYASFKDYQNAKSAIARYQNEKNAIIYSPDFKAASELASLSPATQRYTYSINPSDTDAVTAYVKDDTLYYQSEKIMTTDQVPLVGEHNLLNVIPSILIGKHLGIETAVIAEAITSFSALPHRLEYVMTVNEIEFYNDSQATTPEAAIAAINSFSEKPIHLLAGGSDKGVDLSPFTEAILDKKIKTVVLFPPMGEQIAALLKEQAAKENQALPEMVSISSMKEAVAAAFTNAQPGDVVLLAPACASFGMFKNYQDRGDQFKAAVKALK